MKRKLTALISAAAMMLSLVACGSADPAPAPEQSATAPTDQPLYTVGIVQLVPHVALDAATQGFKDALNEALPGQVEFTGGVAAGDAATCTPIVTDLVASNVDLIMANATPALQAAAAATADIPILGTSVTEYGVALDIDNFTGLVGSNISGTSDLAPLDAQAAMIKEWFPDTKTVGLIYCSAEANSQYQVDEIQKLLEADGITCTQYPFSDSNDMAAIVQTAAITPMSSTLPPIIPWPPTPVSSTTSAAPPVSPSSPVRKACAPAAAWLQVRWLPCPSATTIWASPPVRWLPRS